MASAPPAPDQAPAPAMASSAPALDPVPEMASVRPSPSPAPAPAPAPPAVEVKEEEEVEEKERSWPPPMKLATYAMYRVLRGMGSAGDYILSAAYVGIYALLHVAEYLSLWAVPERARFWTLIYAVAVSMCIAANALIIVVFIRIYMEFDPWKQQQQQQQAEAAESEQLLPPPPPEMDIC